MFDEEEKEEIETEEVATEEKKDFNWSEWSDEWDKKNEDLNRKHKQQQEESMKKFEEQNIRDQEERIEQLRKFNNQFEEEDFEGKKLKSLHLDFD